MTSYYFLLSVAVIILSTKFMGRLSERVHMPQVVGALVAGLLLGPSVLGWVENTDFLEKTSEIGVIILMFMAGLDTDLKEIKSRAGAYLVIAMAGVLIPLVGGFGAYIFYFDVDMGSRDQLLEAVFMGVVLTATSVSITVEALREMGKLNGPVGSAILGAAVLDDIIGIIILTLVTSMKDTTVSMTAVLIKIGLYAVVMGVLAAVVYAARNSLNELKDTRRVSIYVFAIVLVVAFCTERYFGVADITGAYLVGLFLSDLEIKHEIARKMTVPSYLYFSPIFFASIGIKTQLSGMTGSLALFAAIILVIAIASKVIGCGLGARVCGYSGHQALQIGVGMVSRGEVALIVAQKGYGLGLLSGVLFSPVVLVVIVTTIVTPILLKQIMAEKSETPTE